MRIRRATPADATVLVDLINEAYLVEAPFVEGSRTSVPEVLGRLDRGVFLIAEDEKGPPLGCVHVETAPADAPPDHGTFGLLSVRPAAQGHGLGRRLLALAEARIAAAGRRGAFLSVVSERPELLPFYRDLGYTVFGTKPFPAPGRLKKPCHFVAMRRALRRDEVLFGRRGRDFVVDTRLFLPRPLDLVFAFFADASNLDAVTPPWLHFRILTPLPLTMRTGAFIDYRLRVHGLPFSWRTEITSWDPPHRFVDEQKRGPYTHWRHEHTFTETDEGTLIEDRVRYRMPGGALLHSLLVRRDLERIFRYRQEQVRARLVPVAAL